MLDLRCLGIGYHLGSGARAQQRILKTVYKSRIDHVDHAGQPASSAFMHEGKPEKQASGKEAGGTNELSRGL